MSVPDGFGDPISSRNVKARIVSVKEGEPLVDSDAIEQAIDDVRDTAAWWGSGGTNDANLEASINELRQAIAAAIARAKAQDRAALVDRIDRAKARYERADTGHGHVRGEVAWAMYQDLTEPPPEKD